MTSHHARVSIREVTPELASEWLRRNVVNRQIRKSHVNTFRRIFERGQYRMTGEPVQFRGYLDGDGEVELVNGQHRLLAISRGRTTVPLVVVEGVDDDAQVFMDTGARRSFSDVLHMERKVRNGRAIAAAVRLGYMLEHHSDRDVLTGGGKTLPSNADLLEWFDQNLDIVDAIPWALRLRKEKDIGPSEPAVTLAYLWLHRIHPELCDLFFTSLATGAELGEGSPVLVLRKYFGKMLNEKPAPRPVVQLGTIIKAWNAFVRGQTIKRCAWNPHVERLFPLPRYPDEE